MYVCSKAATFCLVPAWTWFSTMCQGCVPCWMSLIDIHIGWYDNKIALCCVCQKKWWDCCSPYRWPGLEFLAFGQQSSSPTLHARHATVLWGITAKLCTTCLSGPWWLAAKFHLADLNGCRNRCTIFPSIPYFFTFSCTSKAVAQLCQHVMQPYCIT